MVLGWWSRRSSEGAFRKHASRVANRRAYAPDRWESIRFFADNPSENGVEALLARFEFSVDPGITDQEEKDAAFKAIVDAGEVAVSPLKKVLHQHTSLAWALKCLEALQAPQQEICSELLSILDKMDTEYERDPRKKIEILMFLEQHQSEDTLEKTLRFLEDANETVRFHTVGVLANQTDASKGREALSKLVLDSQESVRTKARVLETYARYGWSFTASERKQIDSASIPSSYKIDSSGKVRT